jgi:hypothetical protein
MLKLLESQNEIESAQKIFESILEKFSDERIPVKIGFRGGNEEAEVFYSSKLDIWFYFGGPIESSGKNKRERYWNVFGIGKPKQNSNVPIVVEINSPIEGIYRRVGGAFAKDDKGNIFLLHRGKIGGGREGIGPSLFYKYYDGEKDFVKEGEKISERELAIVGSLNSADFPEKVKSFIQKVDGIKNKIYPK